MSNKIQNPKILALNLLKTTGAAIPSVAPSYLMSWRSRLYAIAGLLLLLIMVAATALSVGSTHIPLDNIGGILLSQIPFINVASTWPAVTETIIIDIRLPRVLMAGLVGAALALAGATYQGLFRNPLADPYLIGVAQGAALGAVVGFLLPWTIAGLSLIPALAFLGALMAVAIVYSIARVGKTLPVTTLILAGVALGAFFGSITSYLMIISGERLHGIIFWLMGRFSLSNWEQVWVIIAPCVIGGVVIWLYARPLNVMQLDEEQAQQLGINVERVKVILLVAATMITAAAVSFVGTIGFVGIIVPHAVRLIWGPDHRFLLPLTSLTGASFLILADMAARTMLAPTEIPVGVITAFFGAPFFLYLLRQRMRNIL
ncbi:iron chelate uptake ABC transporter family permease subunit [Thermodesulfovibrionales bacterium]|nr:iron chelate uptake ABC transporter family permease subunit [Thermodesulfovibrionales bacterium]